jgi:hypothetical protein
MPEAGSPTKAPRGRGRGSPVKKARWRIFLTKLFSGASQGRRQAGSEPELRPAPPGAAGLWRQLGELWPAELWLGGRRELPRRELTPPGAACPRHGGRPQGWQGGDRGGAAGQVGRITWHFMAPHGTTWHHMATIRSQAEPVL